MNIKSAYYRQQGRKDSALVLKHLVYPKQCETLVFGCFCVNRKERADEAKAGEIVKRITALLWKEGVLPEGRELWRELPKLERCLSAELRAVQEMTLCGFLCRASECVWFGTGTYGIYGLNRAFGRNAMKCLARGEAWGSCKIEPGVGLLFTTEELAEQHTREQLRECLAVSTMARQTVMDKHLKELCDCAVDKGGEGVCAILLTTGLEP